ncbi:L,D-transpeptidase family protein [Paenibacillus pasadenensis]|uniref:L,D-TPase catalytic domain-containing protein n=1 Tax=Paenibacillus pasadenensis TaxID=217090 RepID=A0A2N5N360_9BACL|nr:L,D-transpeptidase family protein [Paenibacillus pasadenensis]PLT44766.1 hypothetical protein B8V81_3197 [Paenibacillus pasadenensis]
MKRTGNGGAGRALAIMLAGLLAGGGTAQAAASAGWKAQAEKQGSSQVVVIDAAGPDSFRASFSFYERQDGKWLRTLGKAPAVVGRSGIGKMKEGDGRTPSGLYPLGKAFGSAGKPPGLRLPYTKTDGSDFWVDDPASPDYNRWIRSETGPKAEWASFERLRQPLYRYAVVIGYNEQPVVPGKGSAIFLHLWRGADQPTAGCVALSESALLKLLARLDAARKPVIFIE